MTDLAALPFEWIAYETRRTQNSELLVSHLEDGGDIDEAPLRTLLIEVLKGELSLRYKPRRHLDYWSPWQLKREIRFWAGVFHGDEQTPAGPWPVSSAEAPPTDPEAWLALEATARRLGFVGKLPCERRKDATYLAKLLLCERIGVTMAQLDEAKSPRTSRQKRR